MTRSEEARAWAPSRAMGAFHTLLFLGTSVLVLWLGTILGPDSVDAMDGLEWLLFSIVPIRPFTWVMSVVTAAIGLKVAHHTFSGGPVLRLEGETIRFRDGLQLPLDEVEVVAGGDGKNLTLASPAFGERKPGLLSRGSSVDDPPVRVREFTSFDLGEDPRVVAEEIGRRKDAG